VPPKTALEVHTARWLAGLLTIIALGDPAHAQCDCCSRVCEGASLSCTCSVEGCVSSCSPVAASQRISLPDRVSSVELVRASITGVKEHLEAMTDRWTVVIALDTPRRVTKRYDNLTFEALLASLASDFAGCVDIDDRRSTVTFKPTGTCSAMRR
jgi:hypothetical protein